MLHCWPPWEATVCVRAAERRDSHEFNPFPPILLCLGLSMTKWPHTWFERVAEKRRELQGT